MLEIQSDSFSRLVRMTEYFKGLLSLARRYQKATPTMNVSPPRAISAQPSDVEKELEGGLDAVTTILTTETWAPWMKYTVTLPGRSKK